MTEWVNDYLPDIRQDIGMLVFNAYKSLVSGLPLYAMYHGTTYDIVRAVMLVNDLVRRTTDYVPLTSPAPSPRYLPVGVRVVFDIYTKQRYYIKGKAYTVQIHFDVWLPLGVLDKKCLNTVGRIPPECATQLYITFFDVAERLFSRINVGASLYSMLGGEQNVEFTVGIEKVEKSVIRNVSTWSVIITKYETSKVTSYVYDFVVRYRWEFTDLGGGTYNVDICNVYILTAMACRTGRNLFVVYNSVYRDMTGRDYDYELWRTVLNKCEFTFNYYRPTSVDMCKFKLSSALLRRFK